MNPVIDEGAVSIDHLEIVRSEYEATRQAFVPISRNSLARHLTDKTGIPYKTALEVVDAYCEQNNLPVPDYLSREFNVGWNKIAAVVCAPIVVGLVWYGRNQYEEHRQYLLPFGAAVLVLGVGVFLWMLSFAAEAKNKREDEDIQRTLKGKA